MNTAYIQPKLKKRHRLGDIRIDMQSLTHFFCFISVLLIGGDLIGINVGVNLRLNQIFLVLFALCLALDGRVRLKYNFWLTAFLVFSFLSAVFSYSFTRGVLFYCSIVYNVVFLFYAFSNYVRIYGLGQFIKLFRATLYVQFVIFVLQYFLKVVFHYELPFLPSYGEYMGVPRFRLWFYEPSFLATYLILGFTVSLYMLLVGEDRGYLKDVVILSIMLVLCTSTTGFIGILLAGLIVYFLWLVRSVSVKKVAFLFAVIVLAFAVYFLFRDIFDVFVGRMFSSSLNDATGGRIERWNETLEVFYQNPLLGVGPGNYGLYLGEEAGYVPSNVTFELMATLGIFSTVAFYALTLKLIVEAFAISLRRKSRETYLLAACALALIVFTVILQVNQGYLRLYHWMFFGVLDGAVLAENKRGRLLDPLWSNLL